MTALREERATDEMPPPQLEPRWSNAPREEGNLRSSVEFDVVIEPGKADAPQRR